MGRTQISDNAMPNQDVFAAHSIFQVVPSELCTALGCETNHPPKKIENGLWHSVLFDLALLYYLDSTTYPHFCAGIYKHVRGKQTAGKGKPKKL